MVKTLVNDYRNLLKKHFTRSQQIVVIALIVLLLLLHSSLWFSQNSVPALIQLQRQNDQLASQNAQLHERNQKIYQKIVALRHDNQAVEGIARSQLGLLQKGEQYYFVVDKLK